MYAKMLFCVCASVCVCVTKCALFSYLCIEFYNFLSLQPLAVIVCPGWKKAQFIFELLGDYSASSRPLHPMLLTIGLHKDEAKNMKLPRGCKHPFQAACLSLKITVNLPGRPRSHTWNIAVESQTLPVCSVGICMGRVGAAEEITWFHMSVSSLLSFQAEKPGA